MEIRIKDDIRPLYARAVEVLRNMVLNGPYKPGDRLPSEAELTEQLGVSRTTLRVALGTLENQGLIRRRPGLGTFVTGLSVPRLQGGLQFLQSLESLAQEAGLSTKVLEHHVSTISASVEVAEHLDMDPGGPAHRVEYVLAVEGAPVAFFDTFLPSNIVTVEELEATSGSVLVNLLKLV